MNKELTEIAYILDRSGSMQDLSEAAITGFNEFLAEQQSLPGQVTFTLALFDNEYLLPADRSPIKEVTPLDASSYVPRGSTALLDAIGQTVDTIGAKLAETPETDRPSKVIIAIYTDGYENSSTNYSREQISDLIKTQTEVYNWEFLFLAANEDAIATAASYGISDQNASPVCYSAAGTKASAASFSKKIKARRMMEQGLASEEDLHYSSVSFSRIVAEEEEKQQDEE